MPDIIQRLKDAYEAGENAEILHTLLPELFQAVDEGKIVKIDEQFALAMGAGARAISQSRQGKYGMTYVWDVFGKSKETPYCVAANMLEKAAENALKERET